MSISDRVLLLLNVVEKATAHGGKFNFIASEAMNELSRINEDHRPKPPVAKVIPAPVPDEGDSDPDTKPAPASKTDEVARNNMRRA